MSGFTYYKKGERLDKYIRAAAAGNLDRHLTPDQALRAFREFEKIWRDFKLIQKLRFKNLRRLEYQAMGRNISAGRDALHNLPKPSHAASAAADVQYWHQAFERAQRRVYDSEDGR